LAKNASYVFSREKRRDNKIMERGPGVNHDISENYLIFKEMIIGN